MSWTARGEMVQIDKPGRGVHGWGWIAGLVAFAGAGLFAVPFFGLLVMASDNCQSSDHKPICDPGNQQLVFTLPVAALAVGLVLVVAGGGLAARRRRSSAPWQLGAWLLLVAAGMTSGGIATAGPSPEYQRQQAQQEARERAEWVAELTARPDYEVMQARLEEMQQRIQSQLQVSLPGLDWPLVLDGTASEACGSGPRAMRIRDFADSGTRLTDEQWVALDAAVRGSAAADGFSGPPLRLHPATAPTKFELRGPDGAYLRVYSSGGGRFTVTFESACYLTAAERARLSTGR